MSETRRAAHYHVWVLRGRTWRLVTDRSIESRATAHRVAERAEPDRERRMVRRCFGGADCVLRPAPPEPADDA